MRLTRPAIDHRRAGFGDGRRRTPRPMGPGRPPRSAPPAGRRERAARAAGGPDDRARYVCGCGCAFDALVTTSVTCPHCGSLQAW